MILGDQPVTTASQAALDAEILARSSAISAEQAARVNADAVEQSARINADSAEQTARVNADSTEQTARMLADHYGYIKQTSTGVWAARPDKTGVLWERYSGFTNDPPTSGASAADTVIDSRVAGA